MITKKESEILLVLFKDFTTWYNATSLSKVINITPRGSLKALKNLEKIELVISKKFGKAIQYKINFNNITKKTLELILLEEAERKYKRWFYEFENFEKPNILILFGSVIRNKDYKDVDLLIIIENKDHKAIMNLIDKKNEILTKPIHPVFQTMEDLKNNIQKKDKVILDALKTGIVLKGQKEIIEVIENVANAQAY